MSVAADSSKTLELFPQSVLAKHNSKDDCWVSTHERKIYDVSKYLKDHPEEADAVHKALDGKHGTDISQMELTTLKFVTDDYLVGYLATSDEEKKLLTNKSHKVEVKLNADNTFDSTTFVKDLPTEDKLSITTDYERDYKKHKFLDLNKPLLKQILFGNFTKDFYLDQIHRPRHYGKGSAPLFGNFLEAFTKTAWWVVPTVWGPVVLYFITTALMNMNNPLALFLFGLGIFVWTLIEYCLHRFLFHFDEWLPEHSMFFMIHFLLHGCHHYLPMDAYRLVVPPALFVVLCAPIYKLVFAALPYY